MKRTLSKIGVVGLLPKQVAAKAMPSIIAAGVRGIRLVTSPTDQMLSTVVLEYGSTLMALSYLDPHPHPATASNHIETLQAAWLHYGEQQKVCMKMCGRERQPQQVAGKPVPDTLWSEPAEMYICCKAA